MDDAYLASWDIALQKSYTVVALKMSTQKLAALAAPGGPLYGIQFTNQGKIVIFGGGEPLETDGKIVGGFGRQRRIRRTGHRARRIRQR